MRKKRVFTSAALFPLVIGFTAVGAVTGALLVNNLGASQQQSVAIGFAQFLDQVSSGSANQGAILFDAIIKYGKFALVIWLAGFFPIGVFVTAFSIFSYGFVYGFTTGFIVRQFGLRGLGFACAGYLMQNIVLMPALVFISVLSIRFALDKLGIFPYAKVQKDQRLKEYFLSFAVCLACVMLAASIETFIAQGFMQNAVLLL